MLTGSLALHCAAGDMVLLGERAVWLPDHALLAVADVHLGKAQSFRRLGVPVPGGTTRDNLSRLSDLLARTQTRRLVVLGDLVHGAGGVSGALGQAVARWRQAHGAVDVVVVAGNHDASVDLSAWGWTVHPQPMRIGGWLLSHEPVDDPSAHVLCGHLHPCVTVGQGHDRLRLPCFHLAPRLTVLPAFGSFTGMHPVRLASADRIAVIVDGEVRETTGLLPAARAGATAA